MDLTLYPITIDPAVCLLCKQSAGAEYFISTGVSSPVGSVFICSNCFLEIAQTCGFIPRITLDARIKDFKLELDLLRARYSVYDNLYHSLHNAGIDLHSLLDYFSNKGLADKLARDEALRIQREAEAQLFASEQESRSRLWDSGNGGELTL